MDIFNIKLEFDHIVFHDAVQLRIKEQKKGYVCVVDGNVLARAQNDRDYRHILQNAYINTCDGSSIASLCNRIYGTNYTAMPGPIVFEKYIGRTEYRQLLLGNTERMFNQIKSKLEKAGKHCEHLYYISLPFVSAGDFDYARIAAEVNAISPDIIWVSLGAPKQEVFMSRILPYLDRGLMFGVGAAFNFYVDDYKQSGFIWLKRLFREPKKQIKRCFDYLAVLPRLYREEKKKKENNGLQN